MDDLLRRIWRFLVSREFALALMVAWALLLTVWVIPFQFYGLPDTQIREIIYGERFFHVLYVLFAVSTITCISARAVVVVRIAKRRPEPSSEPRVSAGGTDGAVAFEAGAAATALRAAGFRHVVASDRWAWGVKRPWNSLGTVLLHVGLLFVMLTLGAQRFPSLGFEGSLLVTEGETYAGDPAAYFDLRDEDQGEPPAFEFTAVRVAPRFYRDILLFTALESDISTARGARHVSLSQPWFPAWDTNVTLSDFGYAVELVATPEQGGKPVKEIHTLKAFPSGQTDVIETGIGGEGYRIYVSVYGDYVDRDGKPGVKSFNTANPYLLVTVARVLDPAGERVLVADQLVKVGESIKIPGAEIAFPAMRHYGVFRVVRSPVLALGVLAFGLLTAGAFMRLVFPRVEILVHAEGEGVTVGSRADVYRRSEHDERAVVEALLSADGGAR